MKKQEYDAAQKRINQLAKKENKTQDEIDEAIKLTYATEKYNRKNKKKT